MCKAEEVGRRPAEEFQASQLREHASHPYEHILISFSLFKRSRRRLCWTPTAAVAGYKYQLYTS